MFSWLFISLLRSYQPHSCVDTVFLFLLVYPWIMNHSLNSTVLNNNAVTLCVLLTLSHLRCFNLLPALFGAARPLHAGWDVRHVPPSGPRGPRAPLHPHQPLQHSQADHHPVSISMDDHHVWGKDHPAGDGDRPETGLTHLGSGGGLTCFRNK